jgi:hypothetical protein
MPDTLSPELLQKMDAYWGAANYLTEPPRACRRLFGLSYAAMADCSSIA